MAAYDFSGRRVWLTGASSGIGLALAQTLAARGARVALSARRAEPLQRAAALCGERALALAADVSARSANQAAMAELEREWGGVDAVVLNAGTCEYVDVEHFDAALFERQLQANFLSVVYGVEAALPLLRASESPLLVGVSSLSVYAPLTRAQAYGASKSALRYLMRGLRVDLLRDGIPVAVVYPGFVRTPLTDRNDFPMPFMMDAQPAAERIVRALERGRGEIRFPSRLSLLVRALGALPAGVGARLAARMARS